MNLTQTLVCLFVIDFSATESDSSSDKLETSLYYHGCRYKGNT